MDITADQYKAAARKAAAAGNVEAARSLIARARAAEASNSQGDPLAAMRGSPADMAANFGGETPAMSGRGERPLDGLGFDPTPTSAVLDNVVGGYLPEMSTGEKIGTLLNMGGEARTMGLVGDEASAAVESILPGVSYEKRRDHYRQQQAQMEKEHPVASIAAQIGGALTMPGGAVLGGMAKGGNLAMTALKSAGIGGTLGAVYGGMEGEGGLRNRLDAAKQSGTVSGALSAAIPVVGRGIEKAVGGVARSRAAKGIAKSAPTSDELAAQGRALYGQVDDLGVQIKPQSFEGARRRIVDALRDKTGFDELPGAGSLTPKTARVMGIMDEASAKMAQEPTAALPFRSLDQMRRQAGAAAGNVTERADQQAGMQVINGLDDFVKSLGVDDVVAGDVKQLPGLIDKARQTWAAMSKSQKIDDAMEAAENYRWGFSNGIKWQFKKILNNPKLSRGFSDAERAAMKRVVSGTFPEKILETVGSGLTSVGGIVGSGLGLATGGIPGAAAGLGLTGLSMAARGGANAVARKNAEIARALIASGKAGQIPQNPQLKYRPIIEQLTRQATAGAVQ